MKESVKVTLLFKAVFTPTCGCTQFHVYTYGFPLNLKGTKTPQSADCRDLVGLTIVNMILWRLHELTCNT